MTGSTRNGHFLDLPAELRQIIYTHVFQGARVAPIDTRYGAKSTLHWILDIFPSASLLLVSRFIYEETHQLYWKSVVLDVSTPRHEVAPPLPLNPGPAWLQKVTKVQYLRAGGDHLWSPVFRKTLPEIIENVGYEGIQSICLWHRVSKPPRWLDNEDAERWTVNVLSNTLGELIEIAAQLPQEKQLLFEVECMYEKVDQNFLEKAAEAETFGWKEVGGKVSFVEFDLPKRLAYFKFHERRIVVEDYHANFIW